MTFDPQTIFANLAEKERLKGHHSPEGQAIRMLSRALNGWSSGALSQRDVWMLARQAVEDWLKLRLEVPAWSRRGLPELVASALEQGLLTPMEAARLRDLHQARWGYGAEPSVQDTNRALEFCIALMEKRW